MAKKIVISEDVGAPDLITVEKDGEQLQVHPTCVQAHEAVGWKPADGWDVVGVEADVVQVETVAEA